jgi:serine/threonine-protein kinase
MELVTSPSLAAALAGAGEPPTIAAVAAIGGRLAELLAAAHEAGLVHRDVKPANVFLDGTIAAPARCRLSDFGLAFMSAAGASELGRFTLEGVMLGTPLYMAPEQAEGRQIGPPADVYSLGCMIHEMIGGRPPFVGNIARVLAGHMYLPPIPLRELDGEVPPELEALVLELLAKEPDRRPTARDAASRLAALGGAPEVAGAAAGAAPGAARARSTTLEPRSVRAIAAGPAPAPDRNEPTPVVALEVDDPALAAALREHAIEIAADAPLALGLLDAPAGSRPRLAVHPDPTPAVLLRAIRAGAAGVVRWPGPADAAVAQIRLAWRSIHRLP